MTTNIFDTDGVLNSTHSVRYSGSGTYCSMFGFNGRYCMLLQPLLLMLDRYYKIYGWSGV
jgi:hypothetical protein